MTDDDDGSDPFDEGVAITDPDDEYEIGLCKYMDEGMDVTEAYNAYWEHGCYVPPYDR